MDNKNHKNKGMTNMKKNLEKTTLGDIDALSELRVDLANTEKVKLNKSNYKQLKKLLSSKDQEDFDLACETIKNMEISEITMVLFAKYLTYGRRAAFVKMFNKELGIAETCFSWEILFPIFAVAPNLTKLDKELIHIELESLVTSTFARLDYKFIKKINLELKW